MENFDVIIPIAAKDYETVIQTIPYIEKYIKPNKIVVISSLTGGGLHELFADRVVFLDENKLLDGLTFDAVKAYLQQYGAEKRTGWYFQQFLKMGYSEITDSEWYLSWDADTIPIRQEPLFHNNKPCFFIKTEYHKPYFDTIKNLLGLEKQISGSYIAEHMLFNKHYMQELIKEIECSQEKWFVNILNAIAKDALSGSGFSEFETYGTFISAKYAGMYEHKPIQTVRNGKQVFGGVPSSDILDWIAKDYNAISFEGSQCREIYNEWYKSALFRSVVSAKIYILICKIWLKTKYAILKKTI